MRRMAFAGLMLLLMVGCGGGNGEQRVSRSDLQPVPELAEGALGELIEEQLKEARGRVVAALNDDSVVDVELGSTFGELGQLFHTYELYDAAAACYENAEILRPGDFRWSYYLGQLSLVYRDLDSAKRHFSRSLFLASSDVPSMIGLARALQESGEEVEAEGYLRGAITRDPSCAVAFFHLAQIEADRGNLESAVKHYEQVLQLQPDATRVHLPLAALQRRLGNEELAAKALARRGDGVVRLTDPLMYKLTQLAVGVSQFLNRGMEAHRDERFEEARDWFERAVAAEPDNAPARLNLGTVLAELGELGNAEAQLRAAIDRDPEMAGAHFNLGSVLAGRGRSDEAIESYRAALRLKPDHRGAQFNLANALRRSGQLVEAAEHYRWVVDKDPTNVAARRGEARALALAGDEARAIERLGTAQKLMPNDPGLSHDLARLLATASDDTLRDEVRSLDLISPLVQGGSVLPDHIETLAMAHAAGGDFNRARSLQHSLINSAEKAGLTEIAAGLRANLERYDQGLPALPNWQ